MKFDTKMLRRAEEIKKIENKAERHNALAKFIEAEHTEKCRWSVEAVADIANAYIEAEAYEKFCKSNPNMSDEYSIGFAGGQESMLKELLLNNGWGWVVGIR